MPLSALASRTTRRRIDDIPDKWHCSVIGTCLTLGDLRKIARKAAVGLPPNADDYRVHGAVVHLAGQSKVLAKMLTRFLDKQFAAHIGRFARAVTPDDLEALWERALESGDIPGAYWALMTHPSDCGALRQRAYGDVHMLSHISGATQRADLRRQSALEQDLTARDAELRSLRAAQAELRDRLVDAERRAADAALLARKVTVLEMRVAELESGATLCDLRNEMVAARRALQDAEARRQALEVELGVERNRADRLDRTARTLAGRVADLELRLREKALPDVNEAPPALPDLGRKRILLVGGKQRTIRHLEALVARCNGELLHHDGGIEHGCPRLACAVSRSDTVFCAVSCVSHEAVDHLKKNCQRACKTFMPLPGHSVSALERALRLISAPPA